MSAHAVKPIGQISGPALICGLAGAGLAIGLDAMGLLGRIQLLVTELFKGRPFFHEDFTTWGRYWDWSVAGVLAILVSLAVLDSPGAWRRFFVSVFALLLIVSVVPVLVLWGMYWSPVVAVVAVAWGCFCALVYCGQHRMPCDIALHLGEEHIHLKTSEEMIEEVVDAEHIRVETIPFPIPAAKEHAEEVDGGVESPASGKELERWKPHGEESATRKEV